MTDLTTLTDYITGVLLKDKGKADLSPDDNLLLSGLLSSMDVVRLVSHLEQENGIKIRPGEITLKNFKTIRAIGQFVERKRATEPAS